jgi:ankyrin repeat protein
MANRAANNEKGNNPLMLAAMKDDDDADEVTRLLETGNFDMNIQNKNGRTALIILP